MSAPHTLPVIWVVLLQTEDVKQRLFGYSVCWEMQFARMIISSMNCFMQKFSYNVLHNHLDISLYIMYCSGNLNKAIPFHQKWSCAIFEFKDYKWYWNHIISIKRRFIFKIGHIVVATNHSFERYPNW